MPTLPPKATLSHASCPGSNAALVLVGSRNGRENAAAQAVGPAKATCYDSRMDTQFVSSMGNDELILATRELSRRSCTVEADLLVHLGEVDARKPYLDRAFSSMFGFCTRELGFSEGAAYNRILVARAARKLPAIIEAVRRGRLHLAGLRLLAPHLTEENHADLLQRAAGRTKEAVAELVAALAPRPPVPTLLRKLPERPAAPISAPTLRFVDAASPLKAPPPPVVPVAEGAYKLQVSISR